MHKKDIEKRITAIKLELDDAYKRKADLIKQGRLLEKEINNLNKKGVFLEGACAELESLIKDK